MKKKNILLFLYLFVHIYFTYAQQITTDNTQQPNELIQNLVGSNCVTVSNLSSPINGSINNIVSYGAFDNNGTNFPLQNGIILSTGRVSSAGDPQNPQDLSEGNLDWVTDPDILNVLNIDQTLNATTIEFDFSSPNNFISFNYLFASEEYQQEYPCNFQDVFAILIKRAGTTDPYVNIALVPETTTEVSTNTIHPSITGFCDAQNENYFRGYNSGDTNFNGSTEVLTASADILPNETYQIKMIIADHIDQRYDSAVFIEANGFGASINLGPDQNICGSDLTLDADINNTSASYTWLLNGNPIAGENNPTLEVSTSGTYDVEVSIPTVSGNCTLSDSIAIEIIPFQEALPINNWLVCNPFDSDGTNDFNFTEKNDEIYANLPSTNYIISYHPTIEAAQNNTNTITGLYQNTEQTETIFVRIESLSGDCLQVGSFEISVSDSPDTLEYTIDVCNGELVEAVFNDLNFLGTVVSNFNLDTTVYFYHTEDDAVNIENELTEFPSLSNEPDLFYARILDDSSVCPAIVPIHLDYIPEPDIGIERYIFDLCMDPNYSETIDGNSYNYNTIPADYNIIEIFEEIETTYPGITVQLEILLGTGGSPIFTTSETKYVIPISIRYIDENCPKFMILELHKNLLYNRVTNVLEVSRCDDQSNDGIVDFNLIEVVEEFKGDYDDIDLQLYETESDLLSGINPLDLNTPFTVINSETLYLGSSYANCSLVSRIDLIVKPGFYVPPMSIDYCGNTNPVTNTTNIVLEPLVQTVFPGTNINNPVQFYLTVDDAENQENELIESYDVAGNQQIFYIRVSNMFLGCYDVSTLQVNITNAIEASDPEPLVICDDDQDGIATINLESVIPELAGDATNLNFSFFESYDEAVTKATPIINPNSYTTETNTVYIRGEIGSLECFTVFKYDIQIYANPHIDAIDDYIYCGIDLNEDPEFLLATKDLEIINGQVGMQVLYFESENDAVNRLNPIDKTINYLPLSNPQTLYVRLENEAENNCYKIAPMQIEARQAPIYNNPIDIFECDIDKTGLVTADLSNIINDITAGSPTELNVSFHLTPLNAELGSNAIPLIYTATSNPQIIYARVENINSGCFETPTFSMNTLSLPDIQFGKSITACANNNNFSLDWNLTQIELEILEGRQYNIGFTYFESEDDALTDNNPIISPEFYTNTSSPQTLYSKIINNTTGCFDIVPFELIINSPPLINEFETFSICENTENSVDLLDINELLIDNTYNVVINYFSNEVDAEANENALNSNYFYTNTTETLYIRVEFNTTHCYVVYPFQLVINPLPVANTPDNLIVCDDDFDGYVSVDLTQQNSAILGNQNSNDFSITYYNSNINAIEDRNPLHSNYNVFDSEIIYVRLENNNTGCYDITQFSTVINSLPNISIPDQVICLNDLPLLVSANTNTTSDTYQWSTGETSSEIEINAIGSYFVTITNQYGCTYTTTFNVTESESATIDVVETIDFSDPNNITVTVTGIGNYLYQLNTNPFQLSNVFQNVPIGQNTITIIDQNGCASITKDVFVIDTPKHLTPNDDGDFDTWHIAGVETLPGTIINVFDRYGKLMTQLNHNSLGWNGTYNGTKMPAGDYWFVADVIQDGKEFQVKGHFTLRR
ncbi:T9SS type B sorting domain-containing protein [Winogradskyella thalassocola]|uniref:Gliding motility-associated C-terminal domain-containing protein n=1 Tax=Winogradskyella thalassocola TaxID=262004 RepID=A0A1G8EW83_9FLAO|nr:choice-of-anchor L domain-containing protein [Winogradskyella thalassocola]SDH74183.1 gliding motility-associated C-terminal domain-containing protein [Winogradskyella thalassocola]